MATGTPQSLSLQRSTFAEWVERIATPLRVYVVSAILLSLLVGVASARIETTYLRNFPYFFDTVGYLLYNGRLEARLEEKGRLEVAWNEVVNNGRNPLRTLPLVLFAPELLSNPMGHLVTAIPMFAVFLFLLAWTVFKRTGNMLYGLACIVFFSSLRGMFDPTEGLAVYWLDLHASFLVGAACLCLFNSDGARDLRWLAAFAVLASLAALARYAAAGYLVVLAGPILALYLVRRWFRERSFGRTILVPLVLVGAITVVLVGYYITANGLYYYEYGTTSGFNLARGWIPSADNVVYSFRRFIDSYWTVPLLLIVCAAGLAFGIVRVVGSTAAPDTLASNLSQLLRGTKTIQLARPPNWNWVDSFALIWLSISHLLLVVFFFQLINDWRTPLYALPFFFLLLVSPVPWQRKSILTALGTVIAVVLLGLGLVFGVYNYRSELSDTFLPTAAQQQMKKFYVTMGQEIAKQGDHLVAVTYFDTQAPMPVAESYFRFGKYAQFPEQHGDKTLFNDQFDAIWGNQYPNMTPDQISDEIFGKLSRWVDIVMVFDDPTSADSRFRNEYTRTISRNISEKIKTDPQWNRIFVADSPRYGKVAGYRNANEHPGGFEYIIWQPHLSLP